MRPLRVFLLYLNGQPLSLNSGLVLSTPQGFEADSFAERLAGRELPDRDDC